MTDEEKARLKRQGNYIHHLREQQQMSLEAFADRLDIQPTQLEAIERGDVEAPYKVVSQLQDISNASDAEMQGIFGGLWAIYWLAEEVAKKAGRKVKVKQTKTKQLGFRAPKIFAYGHIRKSGDVIFIETKREWSDRVSVTAKSDRQTENGWFDEPNVFWEMNVGDNSRLKEIAGILTRICEARHTQ